MNEKPDTSPAGLEKSAKSLVGPEETDKGLAEDDASDKSLAEEEESVQDQQTVTPEATERVDAAKWWLCGFITSGILFAFSSTHV